MKQAGLHFPCSLLLIAWACSWGKPASAQPNIIHIVADDLGWTDLGTGATNFDNGSAFYQTPNIDALASGGMSFTSAYAVQTCVPTRVAMLTGQYATRTGVYNVEGIEGDANDLLIGAANNRRIDTAATTVGETLQATGYTTAHFGKFHTTQNAGQITTEHGYDFDYGGGTSGGPGSYFASGGQFGNSIGPGLDPYAAQYTQAYVDANLKPYANGADVDSLVGTDKHLTDAMADAAIDFMQGQLANSGDPFYMNVAFNAVHTPIEPRPDLQTKYNDVIAANGGTSPDPRHDNAAYAGLLEGMDQAIGRLIDFLEDPNGDGNSTDSIAEDTVVFFYGDNGGSLQATDNTPLRGGKGSQFEGGLRVPLIAWAPGRVAPGSATDEPVHAVDFYPTFAELASATSPSPASHALDGESLVDLVTGQQTALNRDSVFFHFPGYQGQDDPVSTVVLDAGGNRYKLMYLYEKREYELYDLNNDIGEVNDLADGDMTALEYKLAARAAGDLRDWLDNTGALYPAVRADGSPVPAPQHLPAITYDIGSSVDGLASVQLDKLAVTLTLGAVGSGATFDADATGTGVASNLDTGGANQQRRVNGTYATPEAIEFTFDEDVMLKSLLLGALNTGGSETVVLEFVSGDNPFTALTGYDDNGFTLAADSLSFAPSSASGTEHSLEFGILGQDELFLTAGTILSLTSDPATGGGLLLNAISIAQPLTAVDLILHDYDLDGVVSAADLTLWQTTYGSTDDLRADGNADNQVSGDDFLLWQRNSANTIATVGQVPEPATLLMSLIATFSIVFRTRR
ncbi:sulfatase [Adhaeretor mobilis]|uniref:Arylsulfatase n=1 Tax=Adhaeretor mobilis TaxID=1930276 RepID=A0A517MQF3_9BACT|nr:sulfatase [Adhaeretor mobilis]QDS97102.1 Arylsulfatase [Adhaeretor mobilis]